MKCQIWAIALVATGLLSLSAGDLSLTGLARHHGRAFAYFVGGPGGHSFGMAMGEEVGNIRLESVDFKKHEVIVMSGTERLVLAMEKGPKEAAADSNSGPFKGVNHALAAANLPLPRPTYNPNAMKPVRTVVPSLNLPDGQEPLGEMVAADAPETPAVNLELPVKPTVLPVTRVPVAIQLAPPSNAEDYIEAPMPTDH